MSWILNGMDVLFAALVIRAFFFALSDGSQHPEAGSARRMFVRDAAQGGSK